ncbi:MAG TPA: hypothetical protein VIX90_01775 [Edaphobacter sp.]
MEVSESNATTDPSAALRDDNQKNKQHQQQQQIPYGDPKQEKQQQRHDKTNSEGTVVTVPSPLISWR